MAAFISALVAAATLVATPAAAAVSDSIVLFRDYNNRGPAIELGLGEPTFPAPYNDWASSAVVKGGTWMMYTDFDFQGQVSIRGPGRYNSPIAMGIPNDKLSSIRPFPPPAQSSILLFKVRRCSPGQFRRCLWTNGGSCSRILLRYSACAGNEINIT